MKKRPANKPDLKNDASQTANLPLQQQAKRFWAVMTVLAVAFVVLLGQLFNLQVIQAKHLAKKAAASRQSAQVLHSRGRILDRNGVVLAQDSFLYDLYAHPKHYNGQTPWQLAKALAPILGQAPELLEEKLSKSYQTITLAKNLPLETIEAIKALRIQVPKRDPEDNNIVKDPRTGAALLVNQKLQGLDYPRRPVRHYPQGKLASHLVGFVNDGEDSSSGVESTALSVLRVDEESASAIVSDGHRNAVSPETQDLELLLGEMPVQDVTLTIDARLQHIAEDALFRGLERSKAERGAVIMMDPNTAEVLAFAALPSFDPNIYYKEPYEDLKNWAITDVYPPGSTMKILTIACGLEAGVINADSRIEDTGTMKLGGHILRNYDYYKNPHPGRISLTDLLLHSSNVASAKIAIDMPKKEYHRLLKGFGMGQKTGLPVPGESEGLFAEKPNWDDTTKATLGYGYGLASTPLQMATAIAAIANDGVWQPPKLILDGMRVKRPKARRVISKKTAQTVNHLLTESIALSGQSPANISMLQVAGKTGTSRKPGEKGYSNALYTSFVGYFPSSNPRVLTMVVVDSPKIAESWGSTVAAPIFREIAIETAHYMGLQTDAHVAKREVVKQTTPESEATGASARDAHT